MAPRKTTIGRAKPPALLAGAALLTACGMRPGAPPAPESLVPPVPPGDAEPSASVRVDRERRLVILEAGPFDVPPAEAPAGAHPHGTESPLFTFRWPVDGWYRGFRVRLLDAEGRPLPAEALHHVIGVNFDRRQLVYPVPERFMGVGPETADIHLPQALGVPMSEGMRLGVYASWRNETRRAVSDAYVQVALSYTPGDVSEAPEEVLPVYMDTNNVIGGTNSFELPPGPSTRSYDFEVPVDGALLGLSGHLHDYGRAVRLEDAETGEVLVELEATLTGEGRLVEVEQRIFRNLFGLLDARIPLEAGRRYRVVGEYLNPTGRTIEDGGMAHLSGVFAPAEVGEWAVVDRGSEAYRRDVEALPPERPARARAGAF